jgi:FkbM family methyltransferase
LRVPGLAGGHRLYVHGEHDLYISRRLARYGIWEPFESELLQRSLRPGARFLDAGANLGYFSILAAAWAGEGGRVYAFEPEPENFALLTANLALNGYEERVHACRAALSDHAGVGHLLLHPDNLGDHQLSAEARASSIEVALVEGAAWFAGREARLDVVKIDVQGAEHAVVRGLLPLLAASGPTLRLLVELTPASLRAAGTSGAALIGTLATLELPFYIVDHTEHRLAPTTADALATWCSNLDAYPEDAGFMNIWVGAAV